MGMLQEFKEFAVKGNMVDMAVGIIVGGAFGKIVNSLVNDIVMPPIGLLMGGVKFDHLSVILKEAEGDAPAVAFKYGAFLQESLQFVILAFAVFLLVKGMNSLRREEEEAPVEEEKKPTQEELLAEIRDVLRAKQ